MDRGDTGALGGYKIKKSDKNSVNGIWGDELNDRNGVIVVRVADFDYDKLKINQKCSTKRYITNDEKLKRKLNFGDLLIERSGGGDNQPVGRVVIFDKDFDSVCSNFITKLTISNEQNNKFILYIFASLYHQKINTKYIKQTTGIQNLDLEQYLIELIPLPSIQEQIQIAKFLDEKTTKIDKAIEFQRKEIEKLKEYKESLIDRVVTGKIKVV